MSLFQGCGEARLAVTGEKVAASKRGTMRIAAICPCAVTAVVIALGCPQAAQAESKGELQLYGFAQGEADSVAVHTPHNQIPLSERLVELAGPPPAMATSHVPGITRIADRIYKRMGWDRTQFRAQRLLVPFPPMSSRVVVRWPLREPPV